MNWDFSQPYRTETWLNQSNGQLTIPLCIPSYGRPNAPIFNHLKGFSSDDVYIFIRKDQQSLYESLMNLGQLVILPDWVYEVGTTREAIIQWAQNHDYQNIFMLDDRITSVNYLVPKLSKTNKLSLYSPEPFNLRNGLLVWEQILKRYPFTLSSPAHKGFSYYPENINKSYEVNNGIIAAAVSINVQDLAKHNLHYLPIDKCGGEDICMLLDVMKAGLPTCKITDLEYDEIPSDKIVSGGNHIDNTTQLQRSVDRLKLFWKEYLHLEYPESHPYVYIRKTRDIPYPYIKWRYWKDYYMHSPSKIVYPIADLHHIPGDTGKPWRFNKMVEYIGNFPDEIGPIINDYFQSHNASNNDKVWWVFLYSACYCMGSALVMANTIPYDKPFDLESYWNQYKSKLIFQSDRRYIKNMNQFTQMVTEFLSNTKGNLYEYINQFVTNDPETTYQNLYKEISSWKYYGRFGTILFIFNLCKVFPHITVESKIYDWKSGATTTSAIFNARYEDDLADAFDAGKYTLSKADIQMLDSTLLIITNALKKYKPERNWNIIYVSSDLCSFRKLFKGVRYQGFYVDRQQEEILTLQEHFPEWKDLWAFIWTARSKHIDNHLLGEINGWKGIRKDRMKLFLQYGYVGSDIDIGVTTNAQS